MVHYRMDEDGYWVSPERYRPITESPQTDIRLSFFVLGDENSEQVPVAAVLDMKPGEVIGHHAHNCERFEVVVRGSLDVGDKVLYPGDVMVARPMEFYGPHVAGPDGCTTVEVFARASEAHSVMYKLPDGSIRRMDALDQMGRPDDVVNNDEGLAERVAKIMAVSQGRESPEAN